MEDIYTEITTERFLELLDFMIEDLERQSYVETRAIMSRSLEVNNG